MNTSSARQEARPGKKPRIFYGWWVVLSAALLNMYFGGTFVYGFSAFFKPIIHDFNWSYRSLSLALGLRSMETGLFSPVLGFITDKYGPRKLMMAGTVVAAMGAIWLSRVNSLGAFYAALLVLALGTSACSGTVAPMTAVANWFDKKIGKATAIVFVGYGLAGILVPGVVWLIGEYEWRTSLVIVGIGMLVVGLPLSLMMRHKPEPYGYLPDGEAATPAQSKAIETVSAEPAATEYRPREALRTQAFWLVALISFLGIFAFSALVVHVIPYLEDEVFSGETGKAGFVVAAMTLLSIGGRLGFGSLSDVWDRRKLLAVSFALQALGLFLFAYVGNTWLLIPFLIFYGFGQGGLLTLIVSVLREYFGRSAFGSILGLTMIGMTMGNLTGPYMAGWIRDTRESYHLAWLIFAIALAIAIPISLMIKRPSPGKRA